MVHAISAWAVATFLYYRYSHNLRTKKVVYQCHASFVYGLSFEVLERKTKVAPDDVFREKEMNNEVPKQENNSEEVKQNETFGQNNFVGWGGAILSLLGVVLAMGDTTIQNEIFAITSFVAGAALSFISLQFKPLWIAFVSLGISSVAFFFLLSVLGLM